MRQHSRRLTCKQIHFTCVIYRTDTTYVLYVNRAGEQIFYFAFILLVILWIKIHYLNVLNKERKNTSHVMSLVWIILFKLLWKNKCFLYLFLGLILSFHSYFNNNSLDIVYFVQNKIQTFLRYVFILIRAELNWKLFWRI